MRLDLQKASMWKRIAAWLLDSILICVLAVGFGFLLSVALNYDGHNQALEAAYNRYESLYDVQFDISQEDYLAMSQEAKDAYDQAYDALIADEEVLYTYNMVVNLSLVITTAGILLSFIALEFVLPLILKNGQTVGKKVFGLGLVRTDGVRMNTMQLFVRTLLGKYTIETMIPVYILLMLFWGAMDMTGTLLLLALLVGQLISVCATRTNGALHDLLAGTVAVDLSSQKIFASTQDLVEYTKRIHAEQARRQDY